MSDVVRRELHLDTVLIDCAFGEVHDTGAVHHDVDGWHIGPGQELGGSSTDCFLAGEIDFEGTVIHVGEFCLECVDALLDLG